MTGTTLRTEPERADVAAIAAHVDRRVRPLSADSLLRVMDRAGWELAWVDLDLTGAAPRLEIRANRYDGLWLRAYMDQLGRATVERFQRERSLGMAMNQKGRRPMAPLVNDHFLGRQRYEGARSMMRGLCQYLTDNALHSIELADMRAAWAALMQAPARVVNGGTNDSDAQADL